MALKLIALAAFVAYAQAGGPAAYSIAAVSGDHAYVGHQQEHTVKGLYGQNVVSSYSKAVDSDHSSVRVHNTRQTNDIYGGYGGYHGYAAPGLGYNRALSPLGGYAAQPAVVAAPSYVMPMASYGYKQTGNISHCLSYGGVAKSVSTAYPSYAGVAPSVYGGFASRAIAPTPGFGYNAYHNYNGFYSPKVIAPVAPALGISHYGASPYSVNPYAASPYAASPYAASPYAAHGAGFASSHFGGYYGGPNVGLAAPAFGVGAPIGAVKAINPVATASVIAPGVNYSW